MNRGTMRVLLSKRLQDTVDDQFDDSALNDLLNIGLGLLQADIMAVRPDAFMEISTFNIGANNERYENPDGWMMDVLIEVSDSSSASGWRQLSPLPIQQRGSAATDPNTVYFSHMGRWLILTPTPSAAVVNGLRRTWVPTLTMSSDSDIPQVKTLLHSCIIDYAVLEALGESDEAGENTRKRLEKKLERIPDLYARVSVGQLYSLVPNVAR